MLYGIRRDLQEQLVATDAAAALCAVRTEMVSLLHAPPGGAAGERFLPREKYAALVT